MIDVSIENKTSDMPNDLGMTVVKIKVLGSNEGINLSLKEAMYLSKLLKELL